MPPPVPPSVNDGRMIAGNAVMLEQLDRLVEALGDSARGDAQARCGAIASREQPAVLGDRDRVRRRADQLHVVLLERARLRPATSRR